MEMIEENRSKEQKMIMIVDDVEANRVVIKNIIAEIGHRPVLAENGVQALKMMERIRPHLLLLDIAMPEMDGYELCQIMKGRPETRDIPIIFISAFDKPDDVIRGFELGGEDYITKPFIKEVVQARVSVHLKLADANNNLQNVNRQLAASVQEQLKQMEEEKKNVLYALANIARENGDYDEQHMERISYNCKLLAQAMQLSPSFEDKISDDFIESIELAAPLCDIGNVAVPIEILQKKGRLTTEEVNKVKLHTTIGAKILTDIKSEGDYNDFIQMSIDIARSHHEHWDGTGYPEGLNGSEIPLSAQIVSIIASYCSLTEKRMFRKAFEKEAAIEILENTAGRDYSEEIFSICKRIYRQFH